jgi:hypothetical protein
LFCKHNKTKPKVAISGARPSPVPSNPPELGELLKACWSADAASRPTAASLLEAMVFDSYILNHAVPELAARNFWGSCFLRRIPNDVVPFAELAAAFAAHFHVAPLPPSDLGMQCLHALLADERGEVSLDQFGRHTRFFAPFGPEALQKMRNTLSAGWFHGDISQTEADALLGRARKAGSYLIRYAEPHETKDNDESAAVLMLCIAGAPPAPLRVTPQGFEWKEQSFATLDEFLMKNRRALGLSVPCVGSKFDAIQFPDEE